MVSPLYGPAPATPRKPHVIREELHAKKGEMSALSKVISGLEKELALAETEPRISDHAIIRYLERKHGFCFDDIRKSVMSDNVIQCIDLGATAIQYDNMRWIVKNKCIVTCVEK